MRYGKNTYSKFREFPINMDMNGPGYFHGKTAEMTTSVYKK